MLYRLLNDIKDACEAAWSALLSFIVYNYTFFSTEPVVSKRFTILCTVELSINTQVLTDFVWLICQVPFFDTPCAMHLRSEW